MTTTTLPGTATPVHVRWCKSKCEGTTCDGGSFGTYPKRVYALAVAVALNGSEVCHCGAAITLWDGEVDRTEEGCYRPGFIVMTCHDCNNDRTHFSDFDTDAFREAVYAASIGIEILGQTAAKKIWTAGRDIGKSVKRSKFYKGE